MASSGNGFCSHCVSLFSRVQFRGKLLTKSWKCIPARVVSLILIHGLYRRRRRFALQRIKNNNDNIMVYLLRRLRKSRSYCRRTIRIVFPKIQERRRERKNAPSVGPSGDVIVTVFLFFRLKIAYTRPYTLLAKTYCCCPVPRCNIIRRLIVRIIM